MNGLIAWIMAFMMTMIPPAEQSRRDQVRAVAQMSKAKDGKVVLFETPEDTASRYESIAKDLVEVVYDPNTKPLFDGPDGRAHTVAVMLSIMFHESGFRRDVDQGDHSGRGDSGNSWCMMQIKAGKAPSKTRSWNVKYDRPPQWGDSPADIEQGFTGQQLVDDRKLCFYEGLKMIRWSYSRCGSNPGGKLKVYASGSCDKGGEASKRRVFTAERYWQKSQDQRTWADDDIVRVVRRALFEKRMVAMMNSPLLDTASQPVQPLVLNELRFGWQRSEPQESNTLW
jgi:hypothetical protein